MDGGQALVKRLGMVSEAPDAAVLYVLGTPAMSQGPLHKQTTKQKVICHSADYCAPE